MRDTGGKKVANSAKFKENKSLNGNSDFYQYKKNHAAELARLTSHCDSFVSLPRLLNHVGLSKSTFNDLYWGISRQPKPTTIKKLARAIELAHSSLKLGGVA